MLTISGTTGTPPGTTVIRFGAGAGGLGTPGIPTDFDLAPTYGFQPRIKGWIVGDLSGLGQDASLIDTEVPDAETAKALLVYYQARAARATAVAQEEQVKSSRSDRIWTAVAGIVGIGGLVIAALALRGGSDS